MENDFAQKKEDVPMATTLKRYFPMLKERETLLAEIQSKKRDLFEEWTEEQQGEFLDFCTGVRGIKFLYDGFFKEEMNPEYTPERLEDGMIVLFEKSPKEFHAYPDRYRHQSKQVFDSGLEWNLLQEYICIPLNIYKEIYHNKNENMRKTKFDNKLEAWLAFLCMDDPEVVV